MSIQLSLPTLDRIEAQLQHSGFGNADDVITAALDALELRQASQQKLQKMINEAEDDVIHGRVGPFDAEETMRQVRLMTKLHSE